MAARCATVFFCIIALIGATPLAEDSEERSLRIGANNGGVTASDNNSNSAYSVSFVPLFSLLANFFPRLFSRFSGVNQPASREFGRSYKELDENDYNYIKINSSFCNLSHLGQWNDPSSCQHFYTCELNSNSPPYCDADYSKTISNEDLVPSRFKSNTEQHLQIEKFSTPCITMTLYQCPNKSVYSQNAKQCVPQDEAKKQQLCST